MWIQVLELQFEQAVARGRKGCIGSKMKTGSVRVQVQVMVQGDTPMRRNQQVLHSHQCSHYYSYDDCYLNQSRNKTTTTMMMMMMMMLNETWTWILRWKMMSTLIRRKLSWQDLLMLTVLRV